MQDRGGEPIFYVEQIFGGFLFAALCMLRKEAVPARVRSQGIPCRICVGQSGTGMFLSEPFGFPLSVPF
jgi:hypothetical protein